MINCLTIKTSYILNKKNFIVKHKSKVIFDKPVNVNYL